MRNVREIDSASILILFRGDFHQPHLGQRNEDMLLEASHSKSKKIPGKGLLCALLRPWVENLCRETMIFRGPRCLLQGWPSCTSPAL